MGEGSGESKAGTDKDGSDALEWRVGTRGSERRDSRRKKPSRFPGARVGLGTDVGIGDDRAADEEGRLRSNKFPPKLFCTYLSRTAPAVFGLTSSSRVVVSEGRPIRADGGLDVPILITEDRLPVAE